MKNKTRYITIGGTFLCALGIGFFMQNTAPRETPASVPDEVSRTEFKPLSKPALPEDVLARISEPQPETAAVEAEAEEESVSASGETAHAIDTLQVAALEPEDLPTLPNEPEMNVTVCDVTANAVADAGAMVRFDVSAPCLPNERAVVHHNGMMFTAVTDGEGQLTSMIPALSETAVVMVEFTSGEGAVAMANVSSLPFYDRVVLQWSGATGFQLHAREYGAGYGSDGHVWSGAARDVSAAALGQGGFVTILGTANTLLPRMAEVYTFPSGTAPREGDIALSVEAEVTAENCGQDIEAQAIELSQNGQPRTQYVTLAVPDCASIGDFLVLNNLVDDLKIAAN